MPFLAHIGAFFMAPFLMFSGFFGMGIHSEATTTPPYHQAIVASTTATTTSHNQGPIRPNPIKGLATTTPVTSVHITSISPSAVAVGSKVTITGSGFTKDSNVKFATGAILGVVVSSDGTTLTFTVPGSMGADCKPGEACPMYALLITAGTYDVSVRTGDLVSNTVKLTITGPARAAGTPMQPLSGSAEVKTSL